MLGASLKIRHLIGYGFLAPPNVFIVFCVLGALTALVWQRTGIIVACVSSLALFVAATPAFSSVLLVWLEEGVPKSVDLTPAQAIVVPCADFRLGHGGTADRPGPQSFERLMLAADAYKQLHLPVLVTGGRLSHSQTPGAEIMKATLERYFAVPVSWTEDRSRTTYENAIYTAHLLGEMDIRTVVLITQARDAPRAIWSFEHAGLRALPWPAPRANLEIGQVTDFFPNTEALQQSFYALHELIGELYYRIRYLGPPI
jgi:uncharacterized SAM-binding protein YcdF (DUF218 family)